MSPRSPFVKSSRPSRGGEACFPTKPRQQIDGVALMVEHQQRGDVAGRQRVRRQVQARTDRPSHVLHGCRRAADIPSGPSLIEPRSVIDHEAAVLRHRPAVGRRRHAAHEDAGHAQAVRRHMAAQAAIGPREFRLAAVLLQRLEDHALPGIVRRHFNQRRAGDVADDHPVVEIQRARILRGGEGVLNAGLRKQQHLRFDRDVQPGQQRPQVALRSFERQ